jgi:hypothetical protein
VCQVLPSGAATLKLLGFSPSVTSLDLTSSAIRATGASAVRDEIRRRKNERKLLNSHLRAQAHLCGIR